MTTSFLIELTVLILAAFLGFEVIAKVPTLLHTPLMSGSNAIHGIVVVGAIIVASLPDQTGWVRVVALAGGRARHRQRRRRIRGHRPHAADVQAPRASEEGA